MADPVVLIQIEGDATRLESAVREAQTWLHVLDQSAHRAGDALSGKLGRASDTAGEKLKALKKLSGGIGLGPLANDAEDVVEGLSRIGPAAGVAVGGLLAIGASVYALYEVTSAIAEASLGLADYAERTKGLQALGPPISDESIEQAKDTKSSFDALGIAVERIGAIYGEHFMPIVQEVGLSLTEVALFAGDVAQAMSDASSAAVQLVKDFTPLDELFNSLTSSNSSYRDRAEELVEELQAQEEQADKLRQMEEMLAKHRKTQAEEERRTEREREKARAARKQAAEDEARRAKEEEEEAARRLAMIQRQAAEEARARRDREEQERETAERLWEEYQADVERRRKLGEEEAERRRREIEEFANASLEAYDQIFGAVQDLAGARYDEEADSVRSVREQIEQLRESNAVGAKEKIEQLQRELAANKAAAQDAFNVQRAANASRVVIDGAAAIVRALAELGPVAGAAAAVGIAATTAAQLAAITSEKPKFHAGRSHDETSATVLRSEAVLNPRATASLSPGQVDRWNATGQPPWASAGASRAVLQLGGREIDSLENRLAKARQRGRVNVAGGYYR
jgi:hypothetical protein